MPTPSPVESRRYQVRAKAEVPLSIPPPPVRHIIRGAGVGGKWWKELLAGTNRKPEIGTWTQPMNTGRRVVRTDDDTAAAAGNWGAARSREGIPCRRGYTHKGKEGGVGGEGQWEANPCETKGAGAAEEDMTSGLCGRGRSAAYPSIDVLPPCDTRAVDGTVVSGAWAVEDAAGVVVKDRSHEE